MVVVSAHLIAPKDLTLHLFPPKLLANPNQGWLISELPNFRNNLAAINQVSVFLR